MGVSAFDLVVCGTRQVPLVAASAQAFILVRGHSPLDVPVGFVQISAFTPAKSLQFRLLRKVSNPLKYLIFALLLYFFVREAILAHRFVGGWSQDSRFHFFFFQNFDFEIFIFI